MFGQHHPGVDMEGVSLFDRTDHGAQQVDLAGQQIIAAAAQVDSEKARAARHPCAAVVGHDSS
ncbi:hypothetical protein D3C84_950630 [compost metagenome]